MMLVYLVRVEAFGCGSGMRDRLLGGRLCGPLMAGGFKALEAPPCPDKNP